MNRGRTTLLAAFAAALLAGCNPIDHRPPEPPGPQTGQIYCQDPDNGIIYSPQGGRCDNGDVVTDAAAFESYRNQAGSQPAAAPDPAKTLGETAPDPAPEPTPPASPAPAPAAPGDQIAALDEAELEIVAYGTAFFISRDGYLLTNHHVVDGCDQMVVLTVDGAYPARVIDANERFDLALLKVKKSGMPFAAFANFLPEPGDAAYAVGYPLLGELTGIKITDGIVSGLSGPGGDETRLQLTIPIQPGNSGGPVLDESGLVIGVISSKFTGQISESDFYFEGISFAIVPEAVDAFLAHNKVEPTVYTSDVEMKTREIMRNASTYTWPALCYARL
jgi:S1-C subfamily serine protease